MNMKGCRSNHGRMSAGFGFFLLVGLVLVFLGCQTDSEPTPTPTVTSVTVSPEIIDVPIGGTQAFTAVVSGSNNPASTVLWSIDQPYASGTNITTDGLLTVDQNETAGTLTIRATSTQDSGKSGVATVTVTGIVTTTVESVTVSPASANVAQGGTQQFTATVNGTGNPAQTVTWTVEGGGTETSITADGTLTVALTETAVTLTVRAASTLDSTVSGEATVTVLPITVTSVTVSPASAEVAKGESEQFAAEVSGDHNPPQTVTWTVEGGTVETSIAADGTLTVAVTETAQVLTVRAASTRNPTISGTATVAVIGNAEALTGVVTIDGYAQVGYSLTANTENLLGIGILSYQWKRGNTTTDAGTDIPGATARTYEPVVDDVGKFLKVTVTRAGYTGSVTSAASGAVLAAPANTGTVEGAVTIDNGISNVTVAITNTGALTVPANGSLTVTVNTANGTYQYYRWFVDGVELVDEKGGTLVISGADYATGSHRILVIAYREWTPYSREIVFSVN